MLLYYSINRKTIFQVNLPNGLRNPVKFYVFANFREKNAGIFVFISSKFFSVFLFFAIICISKIKSSIYTLIIFVFF